MKLLKKTLSLLLTVCLLVTGLTMSATAADATVVTGDYVTGATLNLNEGISILFLATASNLSSYDSTYLSVDYYDRDSATQQTAEIPAVDYVSGSTSYKSYNFDAIAPDRMADTVTATLYGTKSGTLYQLGSSVTYSVKTYVTNMYQTTLDTSSSNYNDTDLQTLLADILYYGEASRLYTQTSSTSLISDCSWVTTAKSSGVIEPTSVKALTYKDNTVTSSTEHASWSSVGLNLRENPAILYKFKLTANAGGISNYKLMVSVGDGEAEAIELSKDYYDRTEKCYVYRYRGLNPTEMGEKVSAYIADASGNVVSAVLDYSVESYAYYCWSETAAGTTETDAISTELYNLTQALLRYGDVAVAFFSRLNVPFSKGININGLEDDRLSSYITAGTDYLSQDVTYSNIVSAGFDHVRLPVDFRRYGVNSTYTALNSTYMNSSFTGKVDAIIDKAIDAGLYVILDFHGWSDITVDDIDNFVTIWGLVAEHYKDYSHMLSFELLNEPFNTDSTLLGKNPTQLNTAQAKAISAIRATGSNNADRLLICCTADGNKAYMLDQLSLPDDDNLAVAIHEYEPKAFTHQYFSWSDYSGVTYDLDDNFATLTSGDENYTAQKEALVYDLYCINKFKANTGIPVILTEFGLNTVYAEDNDKDTYLRYITNWCRENRVSWTCWEYGEWGDKTGQMALFLRGGESWTSSYASSYSASWYTSASWDETALNALFLK